MLLKTHVAIAVFAILVFIPLVNNPITFSIMVLFSTLLLDIDTPFSRVGKYKVTKFLQIFTTHRGVIHSLGFGLVLALIIAFFAPVLAFGFFLGFSLHLIADGFTKMGVTPFWPYSRKMFGKITTGGIVERSVFFTFVIIDFVFLVVYLL